MTGGSEGGVVPKPGPCNNAAQRRHAGVIFPNIPFGPPAATVRKLTARQIVAAFPWETAPPYLVRDRDSVYSSAFRHRMAGLGITEVLTAPRSPWQNPYAERLIGSIRRECLDHVVVLNARHLHRIVAEYLAYYHRTRTHLSLCKDSPDTRPAQPPAAGKIVELPKVGGLHHRYERRAA